MADYNNQTKRRSYLWLWFLLSAIAIALVIYYTRDKSYDENGGPEMHEKSPGAKSGRSGEKEH